MICPAAAVPAQGGGPIVAGLHDPGCHAGFDGQAQKKGQTTRFPLLAQLGLDIPDHISMIMEICKNDHSRASAAIPLLVPDWPKEKAALASFFS
jgi:hypothetical protein